MQKTKKSQLQNSIVVIGFYLFTMGDNKSAKTEVKGERKYNKWSGVDQRKQKRGLLYNYSKERWNVKISAKRENEGSGGTKRIEVC